jgi:uncharacterized damage-inducible protein DinB
MRHAVILVACLSVPALAHAQASNPVSDSVRSTWKGARTYIRDSADQMPEADYGFKPVATVRTFGQILAHVAGANYLFCSAAKGEKSPHAEDEFEKSATTKAAIIKALDDSLAYCDASYTALTDKSAGELVDMPFGMPKTARAGVLIMNTGHLSEHYGNLVTYFRIKGMVPPSSKQQQTNTGSSR